MHLRSPQSSELVQIFIRSKITGIPAPHRLALPVADTLVLLTGQENIVDNALAEQESRDAERERY